MKDKLIELKGKVDLRIKKYASTNVLFLTYVICSLLVGTILRANTVGLVFSIKPFIGDIAVILLIGAFGYLIKPKNQFKYFFSWLLFFSILSTINSVYYQFFMSFVSVNLLSTIKMVGEVSDSVTSRLQIINFVYLIFPIIMIIVHRILSKRKYYFEVSKIEKGKRMFFRTGLTGIIVLCVLILTLSGTEISRFIKLWNREFIVQKFGIYTYTINDLIQSVEPKFSSLFGYDEAARGFREFYNTREYYKDKNKYTDAFIDKNVLFIHAESIQSFLIDLKINDIEITPNLNKLAKQGMYFSNFYPQISIGTSSDTEFTLSTGLMPSSSGTVFVNYYDRTYESLQSKFSSLGYYTFAMHANNADYWNRKLMYKTLGYKDFFSKSSYEVTKDNSIGLGLSDKEFFKQSVDYLKDINNKHEKFMGTIVTLTNHSPFNDEKAFGELDFSITYTAEETGEEITVPYLEGTEIGNYLKTAHYADEALGEFLASLEAEGLLDDTVIVIYGDHESRISKKQFNLLYNYDMYTEGIKDVDDPTYISLDNYKYDLMKGTPLIIYDKNKSYKLEVTDAMGMYDVLPTMANMFGFDFTYALGNDIFSKSEKIVIFPNGNFLTNKVYYNNLKEEYILFTDEAIEADYIERLKAYTEIRLDLSKKIIVHDLIKNESKKLED